jgi:hypothetical protein
MCSIAENPLLESLPLPGPSIGRFLPTSEIPESALIAYDTSFFDGIHRFCAFRGLLFSFNTARFLAIAQVPRANSTIFDPRRHYCHVHATIVLG